jgi:hypothetical protein
LAAIIEHRASNAFLLAEIFKAIAARSAMSPMKAPVVLWSSGRFEERKANAALSRTTASLTSA